MEKSLDRYISYQWIRLMNYPDKDAITDASIVYDS